MWVPLVENNEHTSEGADYFVSKNISNLLDQAADIDTLLLACTHYPLLMDKIRQYVPDGISIISQGEIVADSLADYLNRHTTIEESCEKNGLQSFFTTDSASDFDEKARIFYGKSVQSIQLSL